MNKQPKWLADIQSYVDNFPYGTANVQIIRAANRTVQIQVDSVETLRYEDNPTAFKDIQALLEQLIADRFDGTVTFSVQMKGGKIKEAGYYNLKQTRYPG